MKKHTSLLILKILEDSLLQMAPESIKPTEPVKKRFGPLNHVAFWLVLAASFVLLTGTEANAQCHVTPLISGLQIPLGISQSNEGNLLISETGTPAPNTGRISIVASMAPAGRSWTACHRESTMSTNPLDRRAFS